MNSTGDRRGGGETASSNKCFKRAGQASSMTMTDGWDRSRRSDRRSSMLESGEDLGRFPEDPRLIHSPVPRAYIAVSRSRRVFPVPFNPIAKRSETVGEADRLIRPSTKAFASRWRSSRPIVRRELSFEYQVSGLSSRNG